MSSPINQTNVTYFTISVGDSVKICPIIPDPPAFDENSNENYVRGFRLLYPDIGELFIDNDSEVCVIYTHKKSGRQIIEYPTKGLSNQIYYAVLTGIVVHDHASIYEGGPAFATYFSEIAPTEEG